MREIDLDACAQPRIQARRAPPHRMALDDSYRLTGYARLRQHARDVRSIFLNARRTLPAHYVTGRPA